MKLSRFLTLAALALAAAAHADYTFFVTQSPAGSNPGPYANGVMRFNVDAGGNAAMGTGIAASDVLDPVGLAMSAAGDLYVGNRYGNANHPNGGTISVFQHDAGPDTYTLANTIAVNRTGTHGVNFSPTTGEMFVANQNGPISRFVGATPNGSFASGSTRDFLVSRDGRWGYATTGIDNQLIKYNMFDGTAVATSFISGASGLHFGTWLDNDLYVADYGSGNVFKMTFNGNGDLTSSIVAASAATSIGVGFSPDGSEMLVTGHTSGLISKFRRNGSNWDADGTITTGVNMGDIQVMATPVPEPATLAALGLGTLALLRRRQK